MEENEILSMVLKAQKYDEIAMENLLRIFKPKVTAISREYFLVGAEIDDLIQEGMIGLYKAICIYEPSKNHNFSAFASLCIHRQLQNAVKNANRKKNAPLNQYLPINYLGGVGRTEEEDLPQIIIVDDNSDIEKDYIDKEMTAVMISKVKDILNEKQFRILKLFLNGDSYVHMSNSLNMSVKQVDNTLQAIKKKLKTLKGEL